MAPWPNTEALGHFVRLLRRHDDVVLKFFVFCGLRLVNILPIARIKEHTWTFLLRDHCFIVKILCDLLSGHSDDAALLSLMVEVGGMKHRQTWSSLIHLTSASDLLISLPPLHLRRTRSHHAAQVQWVAVLGCLAWVAVASSSASARTHYSLLVAEIHDAGEDLKHNFPAEVDNLSSENPAAGTSFDRLDQVLRT